MFKRIFLIAAAAWTAATGAHAAGPVWNESLAEGLKQAHAAKRPVLIDFTATWCPPCKMMETETFPDAAVAKLLESFVLVRIDVDKDPATATAWRVRSIPRLVALNTFDQPTVDQVGYLPPSEFAARLTDALANASIKLENLPEALPQTPELETQILLARLGAVANDERTSLVARLVALPDPHKRAEAIVAIIGNPAAMQPILRGLLADDRLAVRIGALEALKKIDNPLPAFDPWAAKAERTAALARWPAVLSAPAKDRAESTAATMHPAAPATSQTAPAAIK